MAGGGGGGGRQPRIDLVPIIDAMTCVIFFMLLSSTFIEFTKITLPPSVSKVSEAKVAPNDPPVAPKLIGLERGDQIEFVLAWAGKSPDRLTARVNRDPENKRSDEIQNKVQELVKKFKEKYPNEKTLLLGFSPKIKYQEVISALDGARKEPVVEVASGDETKAQPERSLLQPTQLMDIVMLSWTEAQLFEPGAN